MTPTKLAANLLWSGCNAGGAAAYHRALARCDTVQDRILKHYLASNADTEFGRRHEFAKLRSLADYRKAVPLTRHEDYLPDLEKIAAGQTRVLTVEPVTHFALSSGSTSAAKRIPYTRSLQAEFRRAIAPWIWDIFRTQPSQLQGSAYWSVTPALKTPEKTEAGIPVGFEDDGAYLGRLFKGIVDAILAVPGHVSRLEDPEQFRRITLLFLLRRRDLSLISVWHPSFLLLLMDWMREHWEDLLADLERGVEIAEPALKIPRDPARSQELSTISPEDIETIWPRLRFISCWGDGHAESHLASLTGRFPQVEIQPKGLIATEAFVTLPYRHTKPLAILSHFFEFLSPEGDIRTAAQLEVGAIYSVVVTTGGGLYRYCLDDRVEVTGLLNTVPCLRFLGKEDDVSDLVGEKLNEAFVGGVIREIASRYGIHLQFAMLVPETTEQGCGYVLLLETELEIPGGLDAALDSALRANPHYDYCVSLGQLLPAAIRRVPADAYQRFVGHLTARNQRLGDIKPRALSNLQDWGDVFGPSGRQS